jgi:hypothetical protein
MVKDDLGSLQQRVSQVCCCVPKNKKIKNKIEVEILNNHLPPPSLQCL